MSRNAQPFIVGALSLVFMAAAACGGGGSSPLGGGQPSAGSTTTTLGDAQIVFNGKATPFQATVTGSGVTLTGMAGASFSNVRLIPQPNLQNTSLAYGSSFNSAETGEIFSAPYGSTNVTQLTSTIYSARTPSYSPDGRIVVSTYTSGHLYQLAILNADGSGFTQITASERNHYNPQWSPDGSRISFDDGNNVWTMKAGVGGAETQIAQGTNATWSPDNLYLAYQNVVSGQSYHQIYYHSSTTSSGTPLLLSGSYPAVDCTTPAMSPDKRYMVYSAVVNSSQHLIVADASSLPSSNASTLFANELQTPTGYDDFSPTFSPDGKQMVFLRADGPGIEPIAYVSDLTGQTQTNMGYPGQGQYGITWSPFLSARVFVGNSIIGTQTAPYFPTAAGFLWAENGSAFASFVAFTATTPADATITPMSSGTPGSALVEHLHADAITAIKYSNSYYPTAVTVTTDGVSDALVSFDGNLGTMTTVAPYVVHKGSVAPARVTQSGGNLVYSGSFAGVYDAKGNNLAPNGASEISLDAKTGKLISAH